MSAEVSGGMSAQAWEGTKYKNKDGTFRQEDSFWFSSDNKVAVVADGLGGHGGGDVASKIVVDVIARRLAEFPHGGSNKDKHDWLDKAIEKADKEIQKAVFQGGHDLLNGQRLTAVRMGMAATVVATVLTETELLISWAGDSRAYVLHDKQLMQLTEDHTPKGAPGHIVDSCVGGSAKNCFRIDGVAVSLEPGVRFLLASDGLESLTPSEIRDVLQDAKTPADACQQLIDRVKAFARPYQDNVTVIVFDV